MIKSIGAPSFSRDIRDFSRLLVANILLQPIERQFAALISFI
jgi:hypothetical protein